MELKVDGQGERHPWRLAEAALDAVVKKSAESAGLKWRTVQRAQKRLGIKPKKSGLDGGWTWALPPKGAPEERQYAPD